MAEELNQPSDQFEEQTDLHVGIGGHRSRWFDCFFQILLTLRSGAPTPGPLEGLAQVLHGPRPQSPTSTGAFSDVLAASMSTERGVGKPWTPEEDKLLTQAVAIHGEVDNWKTVALSVPGRTNKACRKVRTLTSSSSGTETKYEQ